MMKEVSRKALKIEVKIMKEALFFQDDKSNKFWRVETDGSYMVTNWGKTGTNGRWQLTEFDSDEECEKEAAKLVSSKKRKGMR